MRTPLIAAFVLSLAVLALTDVPAAADNRARPIDASFARTATRGRAQPAKAQAAASTARLSVDATASRHPISPLIYGINFAGRTDGLSRAFRVPIDRWGGNATSRYNYTNDTYNTGQDWYYENIVAGRGERLTDLINDDRAHGTASLVTVPMVGWVSKDSPSDHPFLCSYPSSSFPGQDSYDPWDAGCGNGTKNHAATVLTADPTTTSTPVGATFSGSMVSALVAKYGSAAHGGVGFYELDNEPVLWSSTHRDVHPAAVGADELWTKSHATAAAVKAADPSSRVLGPSDWGWCAYYYSGVDDCGQSTADRDAHGGLPLGAWYLQQFAAADHAGAGRLLDYFDEHFYPQADGVALSPAGSTATQALRLRSTRSLWDPTYRDESWISQANGGQPLAWIRTMRAWAARYYPGTKTAITEYNFGGLESINGALAQADVLGIFGREGLDLATLWGPTTSSDPWAYAFRMYRNYDGRGHAFGDTAVKATSSGQGRLAIYAATRSTDGALTVMVINKTSKKISSAVPVKHFRAKGTAQLWRYSGAHKKAIVRLAAVKLRSGTVKVSYPAASITLIVLARR